MKTVYTIEDLASRELLDAGCDKPAKLAVIGASVSLAQMLPFPISLR